MDKVFRKTHKNNKIRARTYSIATIAMLSALLSGGKFVLSFLPNIEIVSLLIIVIATALGIKICLPVTLIFCFIETFLYGFNTWVITYFIYWNAFATLSSVLFYKKNTNPVFSALFVAISTVLFGIISTSVDVILAGFGGLPNEYLAKLFAIYYVRGIGFFVTHIVSNFIIVLLLYRPLTKVLMNERLIAVRRSLTRQREIVVRHN